MVLGAYSPAALRKAGSDWRAGSPSAVVRDAFLQGGELPPGSDGRGPQGWGPEKENTARVISAVWGTMRDRARDAGRGFPMAVKKALAGPLPILRVGHVGVWTR